MLSLDLHFDLEPGALDQLARAIEVPSAGRQIAVDENRIHGIENLALPLSEIQFPSASGANFAPRVEEPEQARCLEASCGSQAPRISSGVPAIGRRKFSGTDSARR
jgi:hypothetical protein